MFNNPEFIRNVRLNLRPGKMLTTRRHAIMLTLVIGFSLNHLQGVSPEGPRGVGLLSVAQPVLAASVDSGGQAAALPA